MAGGLVKADDALQSAQDHIQQQQQQHRWIEGKPASATAIGRQSIWEEEFERLRWFSYPWEVEIGGEGSKTTTSNDAVEAAAAATTAVIDPTWYLNGLEPLGKMDVEKPAPEQLETSGSDKDKITSGVSDENDVHTVITPWSL